MNGRRCGDCGAELTAPEGMVAPMDDLTCPRCELQERAETTEKQLRQTRAQLDRPDMAVLKDILDRAGVAYSLDRAYPSSAVPERQRPVTAIQIHAEPRGCGPNKGYSGCFAELAFDADGMLVSVGAWE